MTVIILVVIGMACGIIPLATGVLRENLEMGTLGFFTSIVGALVFDLYLAIPIAVFFTFLLIKPKRVISAEIIPFPVQGQKSRTKAKIKV